MNNEQQLNQANPREDSSRRRILSDSRDPEVFADARIVVPRSPAATLAQLPIIPDDRWHLISGTEKVQGGALKGGTYGNNRRFFPCPQCGTKLPTRLVGVSDDFTEWKPIGPNSDRCPMAISVFAVECSNCEFLDHFKMPSDQHGKYWTGDPLPQAQSRRVSRTAAPTQAVTRIIRKEDLDQIAEKLHSNLRVETDTDYIGIYCPLCDAFLCGGGSRMVAAIEDPGSKLTSGNLISISAFLFELCCGPECGFVGNFLIPVTGQTLQLISR
jgi:hypothetical protein